MRDARCICFSSSAFRLPISCNTASPPSSSSTDPVVPPDATPISQRPAQPARALSVVRVRELEVRAAARAAALRATEASEQLAESTSPQRADVSVEALTSLISVLQKELRTLRKLCDPRLDNEIENIENLNAQASDLLKIAQLAQQAEAESKVDGTGLDDGGVTCLDENVSSNSNTNNLSETDPKSKSTAAQTPVDAPPAVAEKIAQVRTSVARGGSELKRRAESVRTGFGTSVSQFVRDDGTIDLKVLREILSGRLDSAGTIWSRLNGRAEEELERRTEDGGSTINNFVPINTEEEQFRLRELISELERDLNKESKKREANLRKESQLGKLIRAKEIRSMDDNVNAVRRTLAVRVLQLEMEKIFVALTQEFERGLISIGDEKNGPTFVITEFGELDSKLMDLSDYIDQKEPLLVDDDALGEVANDIQYLKTRLGLDATLYTSSTLDWLQIRQIAIGSLKKTRTGLEFYARGFRLFVGDLVYAGKLVKRVVWGYIPTPREVRTIRRTGKDILTLIPFTIILIAPLTPVGHVLVFSFIQRNWPEFFPSTFSERRQGLMKRYENYAEARRDDENENEQGADNSNGNGNGNSNGTLQDDEAKKKKRKRGGVVGRVVFVWRWIINADGTRKGKEKKEKTSTSSDDDETEERDININININRNAMNNTTDGAGSAVGTMERKMSCTGDGGTEGVEERVAVIEEMGVGNEDKRSGGGVDSKNNKNDGIRTGGNERIRKGESKSLGIDDLHLAD